MVIVEHMETGRSYMVLGCDGGWYWLLGWKGEEIQIPMTACREIAYLVRGLTYAPAV